MLTPSLSAHLKREEGSFCSPVVFGTLTVFAILSLTCAVISDGFVAADACTHYLYAKYAFANPINLVDVWARPFCTLLYALPAHLGGRLAVRITSIVVAVCCAMTAGLIAKEQGHRWPGLAVLFTLGGPLFFLFSFSEMTELPFALFLGGAVLAYLKRQYVLTAVLIGLMPTARPEGFAFVLLALAGLAIHRQWISLLLLPLPLLAWDMAGWMLMGKSGHWWMWLIHAWPWSQQSTYGRGNGFAFLAALPIVVSPLVLPATLVGILGSLLANRDGALLTPLPRYSGGSERNWRLPASGSGRGFSQEALRTEPPPNPPPEYRGRGKNPSRVGHLLIALIPLAVLIGHGLLRWTGYFGSLGEARYLLIAAPLWGVLSARGWEWCFSRFHWNHAQRWAAAAICLPIVVNIASPVVPIHLSEDWQAARRFAAIYRESSPSEHPPIVIASHPGIYYFLGTDPTTAGGQYGFVRPVIEHPPTNAILVWDPIFSERNANIDDTASVDLIRRSGWVEDTAMEASLQAHNWHVFRRVN